MEKNIKDNENGLLASIRRYVVHFHYSRIYYIYRGGERVGGGTQRRGEGERGSKQLNRD